MKKITQKIILILFSLFVCIASVSATDELEANGTIASSSDNVNVIGEIPDIPDTNNSGKTFNLTTLNFDDYFVDGVLSSDYTNTTLFFCEDFENLGILTINTDNVRLLGNNHTLKNTVFNIKGNNVFLTNFTLVEIFNFEDIGGSVILIRSSNVSITNVFIDYIVPRDVEAYGICSFGDKKHLNNNLKIINCTINFEANNRKIPTYNYGVKIVFSPNTTFANNKLITSFPLRDVNFVGSTAYLDSDYVMSVGISDSDNLTFTNNFINSSVNYRSISSFPTLDCVFLADLNNCVFSNNTIYMTDFKSFRDFNNYLYGIDIWRVNNLTISSNNVSILTTGGTFAAGTAYPIQLTGPGENITILNNDLFSISNGPNIGIYSQNFCGYTSIVIINNRINVTGYAGNHSWALVAGIEAQDSNDIVANNTIEVHSTHEVTEDCNIYGVAYSQFTDGFHTYQIVNNTVFSESTYVVYLLDAVDTQVVNNTLVTFNKYGYTDYDPFKRSDDLEPISDYFKNNTFKDNKVITIFDYYAHMDSNEVDGGFEFNYTTPENTGNFSNIVNGSGINPIKPSFPGTNPLIPKNGDSGGNVIYTPDDDSGGVFKPLIPDVPDGDSSFVDVPDLADDDGSNLSSKNSEHDGSTIDNQKNSRNLGARLLDALMNYLESNTDDGKVETNSYNGLVKVDNVTSNSNPSLKGESSIASISKSSTGSNMKSGSAGDGASKANHKKAYEVSKNTLKGEPNLILSFIILVFVCILLLFVGYKRKTEL